MTVGASRLEKEMFDPRDCGRKMAMTAAHPIVETMK